MSNEARNSRLERFKRPVSSSTARDIRGISSHIDEEEPEERLESSENRRLIMTRVRTRRHFSRLLLLFSSSEALHVRHRLTLLLLGLSSLRSVSSCDEKTRSHSRDLDALPRHVDTNGRDLGTISEAIPKWMQRKGNEASRMVGQSASGVAGDLSAGNRRNRHSSAPPVTTARDDGSVFVSSLADRPRPPAGQSKRQFRHRAGEPTLEKRRLGNGGIPLENMKQSRKSARGRLDNLIKSQITRRHAAAPARGTRFQDDTSGVDDASLAISGSRESTGNFARSPVHDRGAEAVLIRVAIDQPHLSEPSSVSHVTGLTRSRRERDDDSSGGLKRTDRVAGNMMLATLRGSINRASDYSAGTAAEPSIDSSTPGRHDDLAANRNGSVGFGITRQVSEIANRTNSERAKKIRHVDCRADTCYSVTSNNDTSAIRASERQRHEDHFAVPTMPGNDSDIDTEAPFTSLEGSQKIPVKINQHKSQVEKFDGRHLGPHEESVLENTSAWYTSTVPSNLPKSANRDTLRHSREMNGDSGNVTAMDGGDRTEETIDKRNDKSRLSATSSGRRSTSEAEPDEKSAATPRLPMGGREVEGALDGGEDDPGGNAEMDDATMSSMKATEKTNITILGLFEMTQGTLPRPEGSSELQAAKLAVNRVNELDILKRFRLRLIYNDTKCDSGVAVDRFFHALYSTRNKHLMPFLLGTACSEVTETLAKIVPYWNVIQVSFGSTAPALSDSGEFPLFVRTVAPDSSHNPARIALIKHFGWDTVTALSQTGDMYSLAVNDLVTELEQANITCTATITFAENDYKEQLRTLKKLDTRIIIGSFSSRLAQRVFCEAWKLGMHGGDYAWILPDDTISTLSGLKGDWWHAGVGECSRSQLSQTMDGLIIVKSHAELVGDEISASGLTNAEFISELTNHSITHSRFAEQTYDAVWAMALALARTEVLLNRRNESIAQYTHERKDFTYNLLEQLKLQHFLGVSGPVSFNDADRVGITAFYQMMHGKDDIKRIAIYNPEDGKLIMNCPGCEVTRWPGGQVPAARRVFRLRMVTVAPAAFLAVTCVASVGVTLALAFLAFNLHFRKHKSIKLSSPRLNNIAAVGCGLVYGAVILLGLDDATLPDSDDYYPTVCKARVYLLSAGFSLAFGSMFTKTYRVHRIFTRSRSGVVKNKLLQDTQLIFLICMLLVIDVVVVTLWVILDPMQRHLQNLTLEISPQDRGVVYQPQVEVCRSQHTNGWLGALYVYKGLLLVVGVYMAWETRHVKIPALNDSQYIGMSVYFVVITSGIVVVLANLMPDRATLAFVTITALILASTTATLALLFLPQLANILGGERADPVVHSLGLKIECNTRRFVTDDRRELQYRVEVQNRVYRREMAQLELELARLEKQLAQEPVEPSRASSSTSIPQRNPSIGGGLPLLLLSVLPPVIPRASWPSADSSGIRRGTVAFSSQPDLEPDDPRQSLADLYKLHRRRETEGPNRLGVFQRLFSLFGSRPSSRKTSTASFTGVASALRVHMGYIAGLVPGARAASTCQVDAQGTHSPHARCGSGPIISITSEEDRRLSLGLRRKESSEPRVNFSLPPQVSTSQSSSREKIRGSPRFPHRIIPANSLSAIAQGTSISRPHRWHSMEDASRTKITQATSRGSCSPSSDVWATSEVGVPFSELANTVRGRKPPDSLALTITVNSSPVDASDLRKLFRESGDGQDPISPGDCESKANGSSSSCTSSPRIVPLKNDFTLETWRETGSNFRDRKPLNLAISVVDTDNPGETANTEVVVPCEENKPTTM